jgi:hypothetical protein
MRAAAMKYSRYFAFCTILMSVPLLLSYNLEFGPFPSGLLYAIVWSWAILSYLCPGTPSDGAYLVCLVSVRARRIDIAEFMEV